MGLTSTCGTWAFELPLKQSIAVTTVTKSRKINFRCYGFVTLRQPCENISSYNKSIRDRLAKKCAISTKSGALNDYPYGFASRFEGKPGSNPEELIGAAHAACFTMALSLILGEAKLTAEQMETRADVTLDKVGDGFAITSVHLTLNAKVPGADQAKFQELAGMAKAGCPVSKLLNTKITLDATLQ